MGCCVVCWSRKVARHSPVWLRKGVSNWLICWLTCQQTPCLTHSENRPELLYFQTTHLGLLSNIPLLGVDKAMHSNIISPSQEVVATTLCPNFPPNAATDRLLVKPEATAQQWIDRQYQHHAKILFVIGKRDSFPRDRWNSFPPADSCGSCMPACCRRRWRWWQYKSAGANKAPQRAAVTAPAALSPAACATCQHHSYTH